MLAAPRFVRTALTHPNDHWFQVIAHLKEGVAVAQAQADMQRVSAQIVQKYPSPKDAPTGNAHMPVLEPLQAAKVDPALKTSFLLLLAAVGLVRLIACANVANLLLARAVARQREFALRAALGASRARLLRQLLAESLLLAFGGGVLGVLLAHWGVTLLMNIRPRDNTQFWTSYSHTFDFFTVNLDWRVLGFNFALARVQALPGVEGASVSRNTPMLGRYARTVIDIEGRADVKKAGVGFHSVSPDYFHTLGINLLRGRVFTPQDRIGASRVALLNKAAAEKFFPGTDPIGKRLRPYVTPQYQTAEIFVEIVGVVVDVPYDRLEEAVGPDVYVSALQPTDSMRMLTVRASFDAASLTAAARRELLALDRNVPLTSIQTMQERAAEVTSRTRFIAVVMGLFAGLAKYRA
jgi:hypothetical protein